MGDEEEAPPYVWTQTDPAEDEAPQTGNFIKTHGRARVQYPNGDVFEGAFNEAKQKHGRGVYAWGTTPGADHPWVPEEGFPEGTPAPVVKYEGEYVEGKKHGIGKMSFPSGDRYHGMWAKDKFSGEGTYYYANGDIYSGVWADGLKHGEGTFLVKADESQLAGHWHKGSFVSGKWVWKDGTCWTGPFKAGRPCGRGVFYFPNGTSQAGEYTAEGDEEDPDAELVHKWRGGAIVQANAHVSELTRSVAAH